MTTKGKKLKVKAPKPDTVDGHIANYHASRGKQIPGYSAGAINKVSKAKFGLK